MVKTYKVRLSSEELFAAYELASREIERLGQTMREGVGLQSIAADKQHHILWTLRDKLNEHTRIR